MVFFYHKYESVHYISPTIYNNINSLKLVKFTSSADSKDKSDSPLSILLGTTSDITKTDNKKQVHIICGPNMKLKIMEIILRFYKIRITLQKD